MAGKTAEGTQVKTFFVFLLKMLINKSNHRISCKKSNQACNKNPKPNHFDISLNLEIKRQETPKAIKAERII